MPPITRLLLSLLALAFTVWVAWSGYKIWQGEWPVEGIQVSLMLIIILVLSCTYFMATAIQKGAEEIGKKGNDAAKIQLYSEALNLLQQYVFNERFLHEEKAATRLVELELNMSIQATVDILGAFNQLLVLKKQGASMNETKATFIRLMLLMRTDLGYTNLNVKPELENLIAHKTAQNI